MCWYLVYPKSKHQLGCIPKRSSRQARRYVIWCYTYAYVSMWLQFVVAVYHGFRLEYDRGDSFKRSSGKLELAPGIGAEGIPVNEMGLGKVY